MFKNLCMTLVIACMSILYTSAMNKNIAIKQLLVISVDNPI